jgi:hypothetical protein
VVQPPLDRLTAGQDRGNVAAEVGQREAAREIRDWSPTIGGQEVEHPRRRWGEAADPQLPVEEDGGDVGALEEILQVVVGPVQDIDLAAQLLVDGLQLLLRGPQLLFG